MKRKFKSNDYVVLTKTIGHYKEGVIGKVREKDYYFFGYYKILINNYAYGEVRIMFKSFNLRLATEEEKQYYLVVGQRVTWGLKE